MQRFLFLIVSLLATLSLCAQTLTLDSCRAYALRNQATLANARLELQSAKETKRATFTKYFPSLSLAAAYFHSRDYLIDVSSQSSGAQIDATVSFDGQTIDSRISNLQARLDQAGIDFNIRSELDNFMDRISVDATLKMLDHGFFANALLTQPIFAGGRIVNGNRLAQLGVDVAELKLLMREDEVMLNVEQYYWQALALRLKTETLSQALCLLDTLERDAATGVQAGVIAKGDLLKVRLRHNELQADSNRLQNGYRLAMRALCQYIGIEYNPSYTLDTSTLSLLTLEPLSEADTSVSNRMEYRLLQKAEEAERLQTKMMVGESLPQIAVGATYGANNIVGDIKHNGILFATLSIPLSAWWETGHNIKKQRIAQQIAANNRNNNAQLMQLQQQQSFDELQHACRLLPLRRQAVSDAEENLQETRNYYDAGLAPISDLLQAESLLSQARNQLADQLIDCKIKELTYRQQTTARK